MGRFFTADELGLALFLNAGDPPLEALADTVIALDAAGLDCLELAVPFPRSATDGPVIRRSADRALGHGTDLEAVLSWLDDVRPRCRRLRIALFVDWRHTVQPLGLPWFVERVADSAIDGLLVHALPPHLAQDYIDLTTEWGISPVTSCYPTSPQNTRLNAAATASAYLYLVSRFGRSGGGPIEEGPLAAAIAELRPICPAPIAVGFGVRTASDVATVGRAGADAAIIGTAGVERIEHAAAEGVDPAELLVELVTSVRPDRAAGRPVATVPSTPNHQQGEPS